MFQQFAENFAVPMAMAMAFVWGAFGRRQEGFNQ